MGDAAASHVAIEVRAVKALNLSLGGQHGLDALSEVKGHPCASPNAYNTGANNDQAPWLSNVQCRKGRVVRIAFPEESGAAGVLPTQLGWLRSLEELRIPRGRISGTLPSQLAVLSALRVLQFDSHRLSGWVPSQISRLRHLEFVDLDDNRISGHLPASVFASTASLRRLELYDNSLSGTLPTEAGEVRLATRIGLEDNRISGWLPTEMGKLAQLRNFNAEHNRLSGVVPSSLASLPLRALDLDWEQHTGKHPAWLVRRQGFGFGQRFGGRSHRGVAGQRFGTARGQSEPA